MIYIITHKVQNVPQIEGYVPLLVGAFDKADVPFLRDDCMDNISEKNKDYCELTGLYWVWKNRDDAYKGLVHYRRFFGKSRLSNRNKDIFSVETLDKYLKDYDIILTYSEHVKCSVKQQLVSYNCIEEVFMVMREAVQSLYPEYIQCFDTFFRQNKFSICNMMYCKKEIFDSYCKWLFDILTETEALICKRKIEYQSRLYGFLSERLLNVWVIQNELRCKRLPIINTEMEFSERVKCVLRTYKAEIEFRINPLR